MDAEPPTPPPHQGLKKGKDRVVECTLITGNYFFGRGQRLTKRQRCLAIKYLVERDGAKCGIANCELPDPFKAIQITLTASDTIIVRPISS